MMNMLRRSQKSTGNKVPGRVALTAASTANQLKMFYSMSSLETKRLSVFIYYAVMVVSLCSQNILPSDALAIRSNSRSSVQLLSSFRSRSKLYNHCHHQEVQVEENYVQQEQDHLSSSPSSSSSLSFTRRNIFQVMSTVSASIPLQFLVSPNEAIAAESFISKSIDLPNGLLETRVLENVLSPPPYGIETSDVQYPSYFYGVWDVQSKTTDIIAPCGIALFGGNNTYTRAQNEIGTTLSYKSRFIPSSSTPGNSNNNEPSSATNTAIADREYNVVEIAKSAMGANSILDVPLVTPNKVSVILSPNGANQIFQADLITLNRRSEYISNCDFHCSEVVRQIIAPARSSGNNKNMNMPPQQPMAPSRSSSLLKEIETTSLYTAIKGEDGSVKEIICRQRSATFLLPSQDPIGFKMYEATRGRPIDCRFYDVVYTKRV